RGATAIASYSTRARKGAPVAAPLSWDEIEGQEEPKRYTIDTMPPRLAALEKDPWEDFLKIQQTLTARALRAMKVR
ncbi:MAG: DNA ligase D, partial [Candidatus Sumerlaeota bacterium]